MPHVDSTPEVIAELSRSGLDQLECVIESGLNSFMRVSLALYEVYTRQLYLEAGYTTYRAYCRERWGLRTSAAYAYLRAKNVVDELPDDIAETIGMSQAVELSKLTPTERADVLNRVVLPHTSIRRLQQIVRERVRERIREADVEPTPETTMQMLRRYAQPKCICSGDVLVSVYEASLLANISPQAVSNWRVTHATFPKPHTELTCGPVFLRSQIARWLIENPQYLQTG